MFKMEIKDLLKNKIVDALKSLGVETTSNDILVEASKDISHGDYASNVAMKFARNFSFDPSVALML